MEWKEYKLGDVCDLIAGYAFKSKDFGDYHTKAIRIGDIVPPQIDYANSIGVNLSNYNIEKLEKYIVKNGDYLLAMTGATIGKVGRYRFEDSSYINQRVLKFSPKIKIDKDFLYYVVSSPNFAKYINNHIDSESAQPNISANTLGKYCFNAPSIQSQRRIASILSSLDDKIAVNRKICENMETQAQALFKNWFVDFEPFKNGEFVESELGMIPKGWKVGTYEDIVQCVLSGDWGKEQTEGNYTHIVACVRGCDFQDIKYGLRGKTPQRYILEKNYNDKHLVDGDILVEISGGTATISTGRVCPVSQTLIEKYNGDIICTNFCKVVRPMEYYNAYLYHSWVYKYNKRVMFGYENGTSGIKNFSIKDFLTREPLIIPSIDELSTFNDIISIINNKLQKIGSETQTLSALRDTLLPKLMSGEINTEE